MPSVGSRLQMVVPLLLCISLYAYPPAKPPAVPMMAQPTPSRNARTAATVLLTRREVQVATNPQPFLDAARRYGSDAKFDAWARKTYNVSGPALLAKVAKGESGFNMGAVSSAGAKGGTQFMPATRADYLKRYGVDAWADPDQAIHATKLYLEHDPRGVAGYNPGMPSYMDYILKQRVGGLGGGGGSAGPRASTTTTTSTTPGVDNSQVRRDLIAGFLAQGGVKNTEATATFASAYRNAQDVPARLPPRVRSAHPHPQVEGQVQGRVEGSRTDPQRRRQGLRHQERPDVNGSAGLRGRVGRSRRSRAHRGRPQDGCRAREARAVDGVACRREPALRGRQSGARADSFHYKGEAIDVSGDPRLMDRYARAVERYNRTRKLPR
jgi:hypothetical protein